MDILHGRDIPEMTIHAGENHINSYNDVLAIAQKFAGKLSREEIDLLQAHEVTFVFSDIRFMDICMDK